VCVDDSRRPCRPGRITPDGELGRRFPPGRLPQGSAARGTDAPMSYAEGIPAGGRQSGGELRAERSLSVSTGRRQSTMTPYQRKGRRAPISGVESGQLPSPAAGGRIALLAASVKRKFASPANPRPNSAAAMNVQCVCPEHRSTSPRSDSCRAKWSDGGGPPCPVCRHAPRRSYQASWTGGPYAKNVK